VQMGNGRTWDGRVSRRAFVMGSAAIAGAAALGRVAAQDASPEAGTEAGWSFTDDKGVTVTLPEAPKRVVIDVNPAAPLWDFGIRPVAVFGWLANPDGDFGLAGGNIDPSQVEIIGNGAETIDVEALIALQPDLVVTLTFVPDDPLDYWSLAADGPLEQVKQVAPIIAISGVQSADAQLARFAELAEALGADLESPELTEAQATWRASEDAFKAALAEKPGISAVFGALGTDEIYVANPKRAGDLVYFRSLGLEIPDVDLPEDSTDYWETLSLEAVGKYQTDLFFNSYRGTSIEEAVAVPTIGQLPAVKAGQIFVWNQDFISSYQGLTAILDELTAAVEASEIVTGD
jgi:iron complex transport system substrate-binding protein